MRYRSLGQRAAPCRWQASAATTLAAVWTWSRPGPWSTRPSMPASRCSRWPTSTAVPGSEEMLGAVLGARRDQIVLATKFGHQRVDMAAGGWRQAGRRTSGGQSSTPALAAPITSTWALHTPDPVTPIGETLARAERAGRRGQGRCSATSNFPGWRIADAAHVAREAGGRRSPPEPWSLLRRQAEAEERCPRPCTSASGCCRTGRSRTACSPGKVWRGQAPPAGAGRPSRERTSPRPRSSTGWRCSALGRLARGQPPRRGHRRPGGRSRAAPRRRPGDVTGSGQGERRGLQRSCRRTRSPGSARSAPTPGPAS